MTENRTNGGPSAEADRDAFERAYAENVGASVDRIRAHRGKNGGYSLTTIALAYLGWKLALATRSSSKEA